MPSEFAGEPQGPTPGPTSVPATSPQAQHASWLARWFAQAPQVWQLLVLWAICAIVCCATSYPRGLLQLLFIGNSAWLLVGACTIWPGGFVVLGIDYVIRLLVCLSAHCFSVRNIRWYLAALLIVATIVAWRSQYTLRWRFIANRTPLQATAQDLLDSATSAPTDQEYELEWPFGAFQPCDMQVGDFHVTSLAVFPKERVVFLGTGGFFRAGWGLLYDPGRHVPAPIMHPEALGDDWFAFAYAKE